MTAGASAGYFCKKILRDPSTRRFYKTVLREASCRDLYEIPLRDVPTYQQTNLDNEQTRGVQGGSKTPLGADGTGREVPSARDTLPLYLRPLMDLESTRSDRCEVCGRAYPLNRHHIVWRSWGVLHDAEGRARQKPVITLCGFGNHLKGPDGYWCHGLAHHHRLHFRNNGGVREYLITEEPMDEYRALQIEEGWRPC